MKSFTVEDGDRGRRLVVVEAALSDEMTVLLDAVADNNVAWGSNGSLDSDVDGLASLNAPLTRLNDERSIDVQVREARRGDGEVVGLNLAFVVLETLNPALHGGDLVLHVMKVVVVGVTVVMAIVVGVISNVGAPVLSLIHI